MTRREFEKRMVALLGEGHQAGLLHACVIIANTPGDHMLLTNMNQKATVRFMLHMATHALDDREGPGRRMTSYNLATGEELEDDPEAVEMYAGRKPMGGRRKKTVN